MVYRIAIAAFVIGFLVHWWFFQPEIITEIKEVHRTDTLVIERIVTDTVFLDRVTLKERIDTVYYSQELDAEISLYEGVESIKYGDIFWKAETTGQLVGLYFNPVFTIPEKIITNTVEKTVTNTIHSRGIYAGGMISSDRVPSVSASYIDRNWSFDYIYTPNLNIHSVGVKKRLF